MNKLTGSKGCLATDTRSLREIAPLLENYFGITLGYFSNEIESSTGISAAKAIQEDHEIRLPTNRFDYDAYMELFGETPLLTARLREALLFVAYIITDRKFNEEELYERGYWEDWNTYKGEWAKLMLLIIKNIRADIGYIKKNVQKYGGEKIPKFPSVEFGRIHIVTDNIVHKDLF